MTHRYIALLRGINLGRAKRIAMSDLRALVEALGYLDVRTLLNSGNVVFSSRRAVPADAAARIEAALVAAVGVSSRITLLSSEDLAQIVRENPLHDVATNHSRLHVAVLTNPVDRAKLEPLLAEAWAPEALALGTRVAYLWCPDGMTGSRLPEAVGAAVEPAVTTRNWATMMKLHALACS